MHQTVKSNHTWKHRNLVRKPTSNYGKELEAKQHTLLQI